jgi:hypothetical protein
VAYDLTISVDEHVTDVPCPNAAEVCFIFSDCAELTPYGECTQPETPEGYEYVGKSSVVYDIESSCQICTTRRCVATGGFGKKQSFYYNLLPTESGDGLTFTS